MLKCLSINTLTFSNLMHLPSCMVVAPINMRGREMEDALIEAGC